MSAEVWLVICVAVAAGGYFLGKAEGYRESEQFQREWVQPVREAQKRCQEEEEPKTWTLTDFYNKAKRLAERAALANFEVYWVFYDRPFDKTYYISTAKNGRHDLEKHFDAALADWKNKPRAPVLHLVRKTDMEYP